MNLLSLFKLFFPSWRFFEEIGGTPRLYYRFGNKASALGPWALWRPRYRRSWNSLFVNSFDNLHMAYYSLIEKLIQDSNQLSEKEAADFPQVSVSYKLVEQLVRYHLRQQSAAAQRFQFKVGNATEDALISIEHEV